MIGRVMIAAAVLLAGFTAYQLWGTGLETAAAQRRLDTEFSALLATADRTSGSTSDNITDTDTQTGTGTATETETETDTGTGSGTDAPPVSVPHSATGTDTTVARQPAVGSPVAFLEIPQLDLDEVVVSGVGDEELRSGPGHFRDTPQPGRPGRAAIAGHRTTYGQPFRSIDRLVAGDEIITTTVTGRYVYRVTGTEIVEPDDYDVVTAGDPDAAELILVSCHPAFSTAQRIVVTAVLDPQASDALDRPVATGPDTGSASGSALAPVDATGSTTGSATGAGPDTGLDTGLDKAPDGDEADEIGAPLAPTPPLDLDRAFGRGWFGDPAAGLAAAAWGAAMTAIALIAWFISRRTGRNRIGLLVGVVPFAIATLMFYRSLTGILPAGL